MFRSSAELTNPLEPAIKKATSESLTQDNWEYILDACDKVSSDPEDGAQNAILCIEKRLKMKDGNVLLRTLSLITALAENCGSKMKQEIATKKFCNILKDLVNDRNVYLPIKYKIVEMIDQLSKSFSNDPSLRILSDTYKDIKLSHPDLVTSYQPQKPQKHEMTDADRMKEEEELDLALKLSLQEYESREGPIASQSNTSQQPQQLQLQSQQLQQPLHQTQQLQPLTSQQTNVPVSENNSSNIATVSRVKLLYDLSSQEPDELSFKKGDVIIVIESVYRDWWRGSLRGKIGIFPLNYVTPLKEPTTEELMEELKLEQQLLTKSTEVEKLLSLLSNFSTRLINNKVSNEELSSMVQDDQLSAFYKDVVSLRPQLVKLIEKYSTKKDEMVALNKKLVDSERLYNELMESSFNRFMNTRNQRLPPSLTHQQQQQQQPLAQQQQQRIPNQPFQEQIQPQQQFMSQQGLNNQYCQQQQPQQVGQPARASFQQHVQLQYGHQQQASANSTPPQSLIPLNSQGGSPFQNQQQYPQHTGQPLQYPQHTGQPQQYVQHTGQEPSSQQQQLPYYPPPQQQQQQQHQQSPAYHSSSQEESSQQTPTSSTMTPPYPTSFNSPQLVKPPSNNAPPYPNYGI